MADHSYPFPGAPACNVIGGQHQIAGVGELWITISAEPTGWSLIVDLEEYEGWACCGPEDLQAIAREAWIEAFDLAELEVVDADGPPLADPHTRRAGIMTSIDAATALLADNEWFAQRWSESDGDYEFIGENVRTIIRRLLRELPKPVADQPPPTPSEGDIWQEMIDVETDPVIRAWMVERRLLGIENYHTPLQRGNGRDGRRDYREELLDAMAYAQAEGLTEDVAVLRGLLLRLAGRP